MKNMFQNKIVKATAILMLCMMAITTTAPAILAATSKSEVTTVATTEVKTQAADEEVTAAADNSTGAKAIAAGLALGLAAGAGAIGMGMAIAKSVEGISRQPEAEGKIRTSLMLGLVFVETAIIYALIVAILIIFVL